MFKGGSVWWEQETGILRSSVWPGEACESPFSPEKMILRQATWFTRKATGKHLILPLAWMRTKSEEEKNNNNAAWGFQARALAVAGTEPSPLHCSISFSTPEP